MKKTLFLLLAMVFAMQSWAQSTFIVANGTSTNNYLPVWGLWMDANQHEQFIYPASTVAQLTGATISKMTFYESTGAANSNWGAVTCIISIGNPTETNYASNSFISTALTQVYSGSIAIVNGILEVTFSTPFTFNGGNLLIDITTTTVGSYSDAYFLGETSTGGGLAQQGSNSINLQNFIPKVNFEYTGGTPTAFTSNVSSISATSATLNGSYYNMTATTYGFQYMLDASTDWTSATTISATSNPMSEIISSLTPNTTYRYRAFANDGTNNIYGTEKTFSTLAVPTNLPYSCDFENSTENAEWDFINGTQINQWRIGNASSNPDVNNSVGGTNALFISNDAGLTWAYSGASGASPSRVYAYRDIEIPVGANELKLTIDWKANGYGNNDFLRVYWVPTDAVITPGSIPPGSLDISNALGTFYNNTENNIHLQSNTVWQTSEFVINTVQFPNLAGNTWRLLIHWRNENTDGTTQPPATVDNISLVALACATPTQLVASNPTINSIDLAWTENGAATAWNIEYKKTSETTWQTVAASSNPFTVTGLDASSIYDFKVQADCGSELSFFSNSISIATACGNIATFPHSESFDTYGAGDNSNYPNCWTRISTYGTYPYIYDWTNYSAPGSLYFSCYDNTYTLGAMSAVDPSTNMNQLKLNFKMYSFSTTAVLKVGVMTDPSNKNTFVQVGPSLTVNTSGTWEDKEIVLSSYSGTGRNIAFLIEDVLGNSIDVYIDNLVVDLLPSCPDVYSFVAGATSTTSFSANWDNSTDDGTGYILSYAVNPTTLPFDPETATQVTVSTGTPMPYVISGLNPNDTIWVAIKAACGSSWTVAQNLVLPSVVSLIPYTCNFEDSTQNATWTLDNGTETNNWYLGVIGGNGGSGNGLYVSNDNGVTASYDYTSFSKVMAYSNIQFNSSSEFALSFDWVNFGENNYDYIAVYLIPLSYNITPGTTIPESYRISPRLSGSVTWQTKNIVLGSQYSNTIQRLVFLWRNDDSGGAPPPGMVDNISIQALSCASPSGLVNNYVAATICDLTWNNSPIGAEFILEYKEASASIWNQISTMDTTYSLTLLAPSTVYNARVKAVCSPGDTSFTSNMVTFTTTCVALIPPTVNEPFNTMLPSICWSLKSGLLPATGNAFLSDASWGWGTRTTLSGATASAEYYSDGTQYWLISPSIDLGSGTDLYQLDFDLAYTEYYSSNAGNLNSSPNARFVVLISTDNGNTWNSTGILKEWNNTTGTPFSSLDNTLSTQSIQLYDSVALAPYSGIVKIAFFAYENDNSYAFDNDIHIDNFLITPYNECTRPADLTITDITETSLTIDWTELGTATSWNIEYGPTGFTQGTGTLVQVSSHPHLVSSLLNSTGYDFYVQSDCGSGSLSNWSNPIMAMPGQIIMENYLDTVSTCNGVIFDNGGLNGNYSDSFVGTLIITPGTVGNLVQMTGSYDTESCCDDIFIYDGFGTSGTLLGTYAGDGIIPVLTSSNGALTIVFDSDGSLNYSGFQFNVTCVPAPLCPSPSNLAITSTTTNSIGLGWMENGTATSWEIEYGTSGFAQGTGSFVLASSNPFTVPTLAPGTSYDFYVRAICGVGDSSSWSSNISGTTACISSTLPLIEGFETSTAIPMCWSVTATTTNNFSISTSGNYPSCSPHGGSNMLRYNSYNIDINNNAILFTPTLDVTGASITVSYWQYRDPAYDNLLNEGVEVLYNTTASATGATSLGFTSRYFATAGWYNITYTIPAGLVGNAFIMFKTISEYGNNQYIDDINIDYGVPVCAVPTNLAVSGITSSTANATWTAGGAETQWEIAYKPTAASTWSNAFTTAANYAFSSLTDATAYDVKVRAICGVGDTSAYTTVVNFTTATSPCDIPTNVTVPTATITDQSAVVTWTAAAGQTQWQVEYKLVSSANWTTMPVSTTTTQLIQALQGNSIYEVRVKALCSATNESPFTTPAQFTTTSAITYIITATVNGQGTITPSGSVVVAAGANQTFTFNPNGSATVLSLFVDNVNTSYTNNEFTFTNVTANHTITVEFIYDGVDENGLAKLVELYPNPTSTTVEIRMDETQLQVKECRVYDIYGKLMSIVSVNADNTRIDVTDFSAGVYFIRMNSEMGVITKKFVKK